MADSSSAETMLATAKAILATAASIAATIMVARSVAISFLPDVLQECFLFYSRKFFRHFSSQLTMVIEELDGFVKNQIYDAAEAYLSTKISPSTQRLKVSKRKKEKNISVTVDSNEEIVDIFEDIKFKWVSVCKHVESKSGLFYPHGLSSTLQSESRSFELSFPKKYKDFVLHSYFLHIKREAKLMRQENKTVKLFSIDYEHLHGCWTDEWKSVTLDHPSTFDTLAMDPELKQTILDDLERFVKRRDYYRRVGKAWKRGYLLYGPPGTGKSSLIAAMANYLSFDVYDLELAELRCNSELRKVLVATTNRSILVVEDIDCTLQLQDRMSDAMDVPLSRLPMVTLSGFLNFIDGLWSSCGEERIIIFTTNHKDKLDPALLRPGRMDFHIHMSYCTPSGFRVLAANYLEFQDHSLFPKIEKLIQTADATPAEVAEQLMRNDDPEEVLIDLIDFLKIKRQEKEVNTDVNHEESTLAGIDNTTVCAN